MNEARRAVNARPSTSPGDFEHQLANLSRDTHAQSTPARADAPTGILIPSFRNRVIHDRASSDLVRPGGT